MDVRQTQIDWNTTPAAIWRSHHEAFHPIKHLDQVQLTQLLGIDQQKFELVQNTERFLACKPASNALLWGARGTGKSSLIKALLNRYVGHGLRVIEVLKEDLRSLPEIVDGIRELPQRFIIYCDDLSFDEGDKSYKPLKSVLEGSIEAKPNNIILYATSNRPNLFATSPGDHNITKEIGGQWFYADDSEEKKSFSDRFGLWLKFFPTSKEHYLNIVDSLFEDFSGDRESLHKAAIEFANTRENYNGRTALHFYQRFYNYKDDGEISSSGYTR